MRVVVCGMLRGPGRSGLFALLLLSAAACAEDRSALGPAPAAEARGGLSADRPLVVMSRNLYLGANLDLLLDPTQDLSVIVAQALQQVVRTDFRERAKQLAREVEATAPHAIGLQEVTSYTIHLGAGGPAIAYPPLGMPLDYLEALQWELAALGLSYEVAIRQYNVTLDLPIGSQVEVQPGVFVPVYIRYRDGEAILVREEVAVSAAGGRHFAAQATLAVGGQVFSNLHGWVWADLLVDGRTLHFANAHVEVQSFRAVQEEQVRELLDSLGHRVVPVVLVGDFNSAANHDAPADRRTGSYQMLRAAGFTDLWLREAGSVAGLTCCHAPDLSNTEPELDQRLDLVLARAARGAGFGGQSEVTVVGASEGDLFQHSVYGYPLWASDHAGVVARLWPAPGRW